ncbi:MAG TPA: hypothetical protein VFL17_05625 [Anaerolineae bacterium]|nr:hypothetical protein [Anaerolineae bacterium]
MTLSSYVLLKPPPFDGASHGNRRLSSTAPGLPLKPPFRRRNSDRQRL